MACVLTFYLSKSHLKSHGEAKLHIAEHTPTLPQTRLRDAWHMRMMDSLNALTSLLWTPLSPSLSPYSPSSLHFHHVDETEIDEDIPDGQPFHSNTPNEFWLPWPTLLCRRLILTQAAFPPWQFCVLRGLFFGDKIGFTWINLVKPPFGTSSNVEFHTYKDICYLFALYYKVEVWHKVKPSSHTSAPLAQLDCSLYVEVCDCLLWRISFYSAFLTSHFNSKWLLNETVALMHKALYVFCTRRSLAWWLSAYYEMSLDLWAHKDPTNWWLSPLGWEAKIVLIPTVLS